MAAVAGDNGLSYLVRETHIFFRLGEGAGFRDTAVLDVDNLGSAPIWILLNDYRCSAKHSEGVDAFYAYPLEPGQSRQYVLTLDVVPVISPRPCVSVLKRDFFETLDFNLEVWTREPDGHFEETPPSAKTSIYCSVLVPKGTPSRYKILRCIQ